jgi:hypothetical protein
MITLSPLAFFNDSAAAKDHVNTLLLLAGLFSSTPLGSP